jgi:hypothetical protein
MSCFPLLGITPKQNARMFTPTTDSAATRLTSALNADANMGHGFAIVMAHVGTLRPCGAPAPVN